MHPSVENGFSQLVGTLTTGQWKSKAVLTKALGALRKLFQLAQKENQDDIPYVVSLVNLLIDLRLDRGTVRDHVAEEFLDRVRNDPEGLWLRQEPPDNTFFNADAIDVDGRGTRACPSMMSLNTFSKHYAWCFGKKYAAPSDRVALRLDLEADRLRVLAEDLHLSSHNGCVWFTDQEVLESRRSGSDAANTAYDCLGLNWGPTAWAPDAVGQPTAHAVLLVCPLGQRDKAQKGVRFPTAIESWGSLLWAPADTIRDDPWRGGRTRHPDTGAEELPEGIHGPLDYQAGWGEMRAETAGQVTGVDRANRLGSCAEAVFDRALARLRGLL